MGTFLSNVGPIYGSHETTSSVTLANSVLPGMRWADNAGNQFVYVYNAGNSIISQGQCAVINAASGSSGYSVTVTSTAQQELAIGIARNATIPTASYGWLLTYGFSGVSADANASFVSGGALSIGANGNIVGLTATAGSFTTAPIVGKAIFSVASGGVTATNAAFFIFN